jgi:hypothetical protein
VSHAAVGVGGVASRRGPVSYDEEGENNSNGGGSFEGGRGGGRGRGGYGRGGYGGRGGGQGQQRERRGLHPEVTAVNEAINAATSWRELNTILEQQVRYGVESTEVGGSGS